MKAILLAAGEGTRLRPLTEVLPKCLMPIAGVPLLELWLDAVATMGIADILVNTSYKSELVQEFLRRRGGRAVLTHEKKLLGTAGTLFANLDFVGDDEDVLVVHADNLSYFDPKALLKSFRQRPPGTMATMMTFTTDQPKSCGIVTLNPSGLITDLYEKVANPPSNRANAAVYIFSREFVQELKNGERFSDISTQVLPRLMGRMNAYHNGRYHRDIGTVDSYLKSAVEVWEFARPKISAAWNETATPTLWAAWTKAWESTGKAVTVSDLESAAGIPQSTVVLLPSIGVDDVAALKTLAQEGRRILPWRVRDA